MEQCQLRSGEVGTWPSVLCEHSPSEQTDDHEQHDDDHADPVEQLVRHLVLGDFLLVCPLKIIMGQLASGDCLLGLVPLLLKLGRSPLRL